MSAVYLAGRLLCGLCVGAGVGVLAWLTLGVAKDGRHA